MKPDDYQLQSSELLFPKVLWNRPVSKRSAGRLLIAGGYKADFSQPLALFTLAEATGIGECIVALPDSLLRLLSGAPSTIFVPSSTSGSLGREALGRLLGAAEDADALALGANLSNNSETAVLTERLLQETTHPVIAFGDALVALQFNLKILTDRSNALIILTMPELFKLAGHLNVGIHIRRDGGLLNKVEIVQTLKHAIAADLVVYGTETIVAVGDDISVTPTNPVLSRIPAAYFATLGVFWLQHQKQRYEALTTAAWVLAHAGADLKQQELPTVGSVAKLIAKAVEHEA